MPDTLTEIRAAHVKATPHDFCDKDGEWWPCDTTKALAHLDSLTAAVEGLTLYDENARTMADAAESMKRRVLAILRGEQ